jgi:hypothetical protein
MATAKSLAKIIGITVAILIAVYIAAPFALAPFVDPCQLSLVSELSSPSGKLIARHYHAKDCDKQPIEESQVWIGEPKPGLSGSRVFASPYAFLDKASGQTRRAELRLIWRGEDMLEILYPREIFPRDPGHSVTRNGLEVRVDSRYLEVPSNNQMQSGPAQAPAADLKR